MKISAVIITFNEAENIGEAIKSLDFADEIIVADSESTDQTREIAESFRAEVIVQKWLGFGQQKQFAVEKAAYDWVFSLDADERVSAELKAAILRLKSLPENDLADGYKFSRTTFYLGRRILHGGWYPDWQLRFFNRKKGKWKPVEIHESVEMIKNTRVEKLKKDILHYSIPDATYHHRLIGERYAPLAAKKMFKDGRKTGFLKIATVGFTTFFQIYFLKLGFLDGFPGFCIARFAAHHAFLKHLLLWEIQRQESKNRLGKQEN